MRWLRRVVRREVIMAAVLGVTAACGDDDPVVQQAYGFVAIELRIAALVDEVSFTLTGPNGLTRTGALVPENGVAAATIDRLPAGDGYEVSAGASTAAGSRCEGSSPAFAVAADEISHVLLSLGCERTGAPLGDGGLNRCPSVGAIVGAHRAYVGESLRFVGSGRDPDGAPSPLAYAWTASSGTLGDPGAPEVTFTCTAEGPTTLTLTVSDGDATAGCADSVSLTVTCVPAIERIGHLVVIYMENHSFDNLYGSYPGAEGLASPAAIVPQIDDATGLPYPTLPQTDPNIPLGLPNRPFDLSLYVPIDQKTIDPVHAFYQQQQQINGGLMDRFVTVSNAKGLVLGAYPTAMLPVARLAADNPAETTMCDHFFHAAFGGSFLNHHWLIAAATPLFPNAPRDLVAEFDAAGNLVADRPVTPDGHVVNGLEPFSNPHSAGADPARLVPPQDAPTIGDRLSAAGVDWGWYAGSWDDAVAGNGALFSAGHNPFIYYANYAEGTAARAAHLKDEDTLAAEIAAGTLPPVVFVKPEIGLDEHPQQSDLLAGQEHSVALIQRLMASPSWKDTVVILTYDENGGYWDHVPPPVVDPWGPGTRVPTLVFSPFAKGGVDSTVYDTTAILKLIERRWKLAPLGTRDAAQPDLSAHALRLSP